MVAPYNYSIGGVDPGMAFTAGIQGGLEARANEQAMAQQQQQRALAMQAAQQKMVADQQRQQALSALYNNPAPTLADYRRIMVLMPEQSEAFKRAADSLSTEQVQTALSESGQVLAAVRQGRPEIAVSYLERLAGQMEKTDPEGAKARRAVAEAIKIDPKVAADGIALRAAGLPGGDKLIEGLGKLGEQQRAEAEAPAKLETLKAGARTATANATTAEEVARNAPLAERAKAEEAAAKAQQEAVKARFADELARLSVTRSRAEISNINSQISDRGTRLKIDLDKAAMETAEKLGSLGTTKLDAAQRKIVDEAVVSAATANQVAGNLESLASQFESAGGGWGQISRMGEFFKNSLGMQNQMSALRQEYIRVRNNLAMKSLPPGPATDRDIELAMAGFPKETANSQEIAQFLRGMSKLSKIESSVSSARADWVSANGGLAPAKAPAVISGVQVKPGMRFEEVAAQIADRIKSPPAAPKPGAPKPAAAPAAASAPIRVNY